MTDMDRSAIETVDEGTHRYTIARRTSASNWYDLEVAGPDGAYVIRRLSYPSAARDAAIVAPAPTAELNGAVLVGGRSQGGVWHVFAPDRAQAGGLEANRLYVLSELASLSPVEHFPIPDIRIVARDETESSFEGPVTQAFGRVVATYGVNLSDDTYYDKTLYFLQNEAEIVEDEEAEMDAVAAAAGYDSYTQFQYDDAGEPATSVSRYAVDQMDWVDVIELSPQAVVDFVLEPSEKLRDDMLKEVLLAYREGGMPETTFDGGRRSAEQIRAACRSAGGPAA